MRIDSLDALPGLLPGSYRGRTLHFLDASSEHGRRVLEYLFPGVDAPAYDDFGLLPSVVTIDALVIGDDYKGQVKSLQRAFETPGPGLLMHPWLGPMSVILEEPASIAFSVRELRVARINVRLKRVQIGGGVGQVLSGLGGGVASLLSAAQALIDVVDVLVLSAARGAAIRRTVRLIAAAANAVTPPSDGARLLPEIRSILAASAPETPATFGSWLSGAVSVLSAVAEEPAVASALASPPVSTAQAKIAVASDLAGRMMDAAASAPSQVDAALLVAAAAEFLSAAARQSVYADFASRREATAYRTAMTAALSALIDRAEILGSDTYQAASSELIRGARRVSSAVVIEMNEVVGRLPEVLVFASEREHDAWQVAQHIAGDRPGQIEAVYLDIVARNRPRHPAVMEGSTVEALEIR
uniref:DNA circulation N-terminal domain-containing protein n=1 Tax=Agrobacterium albertimagni TaxID=147266 RepID=A0A7C1P8V6_9HYPH